MSDRVQLTGIAHARIEDAEALVRAGRYDGAVYLCGYAVEIGLKVRICRTLKWPAFPDSAKQFKDYQSFKTHNLSVLLHLSGIERGVKRNLLAEWSVLATWDPEIRYKPAGSTAEEDARNMIDASKTLVEFLCGK